MEQQKRKVFLINPPFQYSVIRLMFVLMILVILIMGLIGYWQFQPLLSEVKSLGLSEQHPVSMAIDHFYFMLGLSLGLGSLAFTCIFFVAGLLLSHRIAGPLFNLKRHLGQVRENNEFNPVKFRDTDYFHDLEDEFNKFIEFSRSKSK